MKNLIREHIKKTIHLYLMEQLYEERAYPLSLLSAACSMALDKLEIPISAITDVKIIKATRPIFKVFLENGESFNLIDNSTSSSSFIQADIDRILFDLDNERDLNAAKSEIDRIVNLGHMKDDNKGEIDGEFEEPVEEPAEEPAPEEEV